MSDGWPPPGWYEDAQPGHLRWWDGREWTWHWVGHSGVPALPPGGRSRRIRPWVVVVAVAAGLAVVSGVVAGGIYVGLHSHLFTSRYAIAGAPGYETYSGPEHAPLAVGRPWGTRCQPIVFVVNAAVPDATYLRIADTITSARSLGVDVGIQAREGTWQPGLLYPPGLTNADVKFVDIYADDGTPPPLGNGKPEHIGFGWDTRYRGGHDAVTGMQATLYLRAVDDADGFLVRRSIRQLVAFSQGIFLARDPASGIADNSATDTFTIKDVHAMQVMSGCNP